MTRRPSVWMTRGCPLLEPPWPAVAYGGPVLLADGIGLIRQQAIKHARSHAASACTRAGELTAAPKKLCCEPTVWGQRHNTIFGLQASCRTDRGARTWGRGSWSGAMRFQQQALRRL